MKWQEANEPKGLLRTMLLNKGLYYLMLIGTLGLLLGAGFKWHP